jgi:membrane protein DedA with SNARE-associated domain
LSTPRLAAAIGAVGLLGLAAWRLRSGRPGRAALGLLGAAILGMIAADQMVPLPDGEEAVSDFGATFGGWAYPFMAAMAFLETAIPPVTLVFPGEFAVLLGGAVAGEGDIALVPLMAIVWACSAAGDSVTFALGRRLGRPFLLRHGRPLGMSNRRLERLDRWLDRWGSAAVCLGRLLPLARPFGPFVAGASRFRYGRFLAWNLVGTLLFTLVFCGAGYVFYRSYDDVVVALRGGGFVVLLLIAAGALAAWAVNRRRAARRAGAR